jgi:hypothetical protein
VSRRTAALVLAAALLVVALGVTWVVKRRPPRGSLPPAAAEASPASPAAEATERWTATLWLPSESGRLEGRPAALASGAEARARGEAVLAALLAARPEPPLGPVFPGAVAVGRLLLVDGTAYVDLRPEDGGEPPSTGSTLELLRVYAIVHTLVRNVPEVRQVVLLWNGVQRRGFPGHVDTARPLVPLAALEGS